MLLDFSKPKDKQSINLHTSKGSSIENEQYTGLEDNALVRFTISEIQRKFPNVIFRNSPTDCYNCHGMTFASRRTGIYDTEEIIKILHDDNYSEITNITDVLPGDIVIWYSNSGGDAEHSGIVITKPDLDIKVPMVLSKWGITFEVIHSVYITPYENATIRYFRCNL